MSPSQKHWGHVSLFVSARGLTTTPIPAGRLTFEMLLDLVAHRLEIDSSRGDHWHTRLRGQSPAEFCQQALSALMTMGIAPELDTSQFSDTAPGEYDLHAVERYWQALAQIDMALKQFKGELPGKTSPVQLWPHHFDLAMLWFSGRRVPGVDPSDEENADEQMNFGFSTGDAGIPEAYFYATAYPLPETWLDASLPPGAEWHTQGWKGAVMRYQTLEESPNPQERLLEFWRTAQKAGAVRMQA